MILNLKKYNWAFSGIGKNLAKNESPMCWIVGLLLGISADLHPICRFFPGFIWKLIGWKCLIVMLTGIWSQNVSQFGLRCYWLAPKFSDLHQNLTWLQSGNLSTVPRFPLDNPNSKTYHENCRSLSFLGCKMGCYA